MDKLHGKKILAVLGYEGYFGGERANLQVLKMIRNGGAEVECLVVSKGGNAFKQVVKQEGFKLHPAKFGPSLFGLSGNPIHYLKNLTGMLFVSFKMISVAKQYRPTHIYVPNYIQFLYVWPGLCLIRVPVVFRIGDPPEGTPFHKYLWRKIISPQVKFFIANSKYTLACLFNTGVTENKGRVINNCLTRTAGVCESVKKNHHDRVIVYAGQINAQKGVDIAVHAAVILCRKYDDLIFKFLGPFDENSQFVKALFLTIKDEELTARILFPGFEKDVLRHFKTSFLHLCPSVQEESSANVVIEAKSCAVPSIVFPRGGLPELIRHKHDGYICESTDVEGLVRGIDFFMTDQARQKNACIEAEMSFAQFSEEIAQDNWARVFDA